MEARLTLFIVSLSLLPSLEAAYCGSSAIPYSFEVRFCFDHFILQLLASKKQKRELKQKKPKNS